MKSYKQKNYEQALIETYLKFDELLRIEKVNQFLKNNFQSKKESRLDITFSNGINLDSNSRTENNDVIKKEESKSKASLKKKIPQENIIDLTKKDIVTPCSSSNEGNNESGSKSLSNEILTMEDKKIEISMKNSNGGLKSDLYDELIAKDMGTTANILLIKNNYLYLANVGDSIAVLFKNGVAVRLNQEHKTTLPSEFTRISKSGAKIINNRIEGRLNLTRAIGILILNLGDLNFKNNQNLKFYEQAVTAYPEITKMKITKDIEFILMACDGVWDCVDIQKLCEHISFQLKSNIKISSIIEDLFDKIISKTNNSNINFNIQPLLELIICHVF